MAQVDVQWPSEDEDFDATVDKVIASRAEKAAEPKRTAVAVLEPAEEKEEPVESDMTHPSITNPESKIAPTNNDQSEISSMHEAEKPVVPPIDSGMPTAAPNDKQKGGGIGRIVFEVVLVLAIVALAAWSYVLLTARNDAQTQVVDLKKEVANLYANPQVAVQKQTNDLLKKVGALMDLPQGETPTVANVTDAAAAKKESAFFNNAQNDDKVLMYVKAGEAILYRPSTNKIILVAPLNFTGTTSSVNAPTSAAKPSAR